MAAEVKPPKLSMLALLGGGLGAAVGLAVGPYAGLSLLIPAGFALLVGWALSKAVPAPNKPMVPASAVQAGQGLWMLLGMVLLGQVNLTLIDCAVLLLGALGLAFWPSVVVVALLICYQAVGLVSNGVGFAEATLNTPVHKALLVHLVLRVTAIILMVAGLIKIRKEKTLATVPSASGPTGGGSTDKSPGA